MHPIVFSAQVNLLGWGPGIQFFIWDESLRGPTLQYEFHWRYFRAQRGRLDLTVQWL
jgi:hypothetical protein